MAKTSLIWIFLVLLLAVSGIASAQVDKPDQDRHALVIGNSNYLHASPLANGVHDARDMSKVLEEVGFEVTLGIDVDTLAFRALVGQFRRKLDPGDVSLFYFAGHGIQANGENYLLPVDAALKRPADLALEGERLQDIISAMTVEQNTAIVLLDACRDNPFVTQLSGQGGTRGITIEKGLGAVDAGRGVFIGFATQPGNVAFDGTEKHSPFADALLKRIATPAIDIEILMRRVRQDVLNATAGRQVPWSNSSLVEPGFSFRPGTPSAETSSDPAQPDINTATDLEYWQSIKDTSDASMYRAYLAAFPNGAFTAIAKRRLALLEAPAPKKSAPSAKAAPKVKSSSLPNKATTTTRSGTATKTVQPAQGGRCRDGNIERCRQNCRAGRRGACRMLRRLGG